MSIQLPLSDTEKQWLQHFERKLDELGGKQEYATPFFDPRQLELAETALQKRKDLSYTVFGGHSRAERNSLNIYSAQKQGELPPVRAVMVKWNSEENELSHRDLLGAILSLGLRRDQIGDILMLQDSCAAVMVSASKAEYIALNLVRAGSVTVSCSVNEAEELSLSGDEGKEIKGTVASLRIDAVLALGFGISRSRVVLLVKGGVVRVNWRPVSSPSQLLKEGDMLSLKGRGRLLVSAVEGETRKGRMRVKLKKYS